MSKRNHAFRRNRRVAYIVAASAVGVAAIAAASTSFGLVGGKETTTSDNPFMVQLVFKGKTVPCVGALVSHTKVVTAAQCFAQLDNQALRQVQVIAGRTNLHDKNGDIRRIKKVWTADYQAPQEGSDPTPPVNDLAVLTLSAPMPDKYTPVRYVTAQDAGDGIYGENAKARILGWGNAALMEDLPGPLQEAHPDILADSDCETAYPGDFDATKNVCVGKEEGGVDFCEGDTGGPLLITKGDEEVLAGVASWGGQKCGAAQNPGVFTKLTSYSDAVTREVHSSRGSGILQGLLGTSH
jgi:secreted trypsin-like serine protease